ncbi:MAG TPA: FkbM family methyltransferase [Acidimicrobiales bacterium]|nr:FkbM family methyltransferase [Acidimicrobiales bacterium]
MDNFGQSTVLVRALASRGVFASHPFTLIDIGSRGGIDPAWKLFGSNLVAFGFDPNVSECARLQARESSPSIRYIPAFVGLPPSDPFRQRVGEQLWSRNPWHRLSASRSVESRRRSLAAVRGPKRDLTWDRDTYVERGQTLVLSEFLANEEISEVDFVKVDVDGEDLVVLTSLQDHLGPWGVLGLSVEVNYFGSARPEDNTFHNVDRLLKSRQFEIFDVSSRRYSTSALPDRFVGSSPGPTRRGRVLQGDATYLRDLADPAIRRAQEWAPPKILKLCASSISSAWATAPPSCSSS